jgi:hypothetical protein
VRVETLMNCRIALANAILCPSKTGLGFALNTFFGAFVLPVSSEAVFPYQGASYEYKDDDDGRAGSDPLAGNFGGFCFAAGTPVDTPDGLRLIEQIRVGDVVMSRDEQTGEMRPEHVLRIFVTPDQPLVDLTLGMGDHVRATPGHLFWTEDRGWVPAAYLEVGETLFGEHGPVEVSAAASLSGNATVYNMEIEDTHTYFVGVSSAWVHNPKKPPQPGGPNACAQPPAPPAQNAHGRCTDQQWDRLYPPMKKACAVPHSCSDADTCSSASASLSAGYACLSGREAVQSTCYRPGDPGYEGHMKRIAQEYSAVRYCDAIMKKKMPMKRSSQVAHATESIARAFRDVPYPGDDNVVSGSIDYDPEYRETAAGLRGKKWPSLTREDVRTYSLALLSPAAFRYFLPAYMTACAEGRRDLNITPISVIMNLTPPPIGTAPDHWDHILFWSRAPLFGPQEAAAIVEYLELAADLERDEWGDEDPPAAPVRPALTWWRERARELACAAEKHGK